MFPRLSFLRNSLLVKILLLLIVCAACERKEHLNNREELEKMRKDYLKAFDKRDPQALASFWSKDSSYSNPTTGKYLVGPQEVAEEFKEWFENTKVDRLEMTITEFNFLDADKVIEKGSYKLIFKDRPPLENAFSAVLVKEDGNWKFSKVRQIHIEEVPSHYEKLKNLGWLIGKWEDTDDDISIITTTSWGKNKNFIIQNFTMKLYDQDVLEGQQVIGWDPRLEKIRSWTFDSDGGFGEGVWTEVDNRLYAKMNFTLPNGDKASAINIYTKTDADSYIWSSEARDVNGAILPNIKPIHIKRVSE